MGPESEESLVDLQMQSIAARRVNDRKRDHETARTAMQKFPGEWGSYEMMGDNLMPDKPEEAIGFYRRATESGGDTLGLWRNLACALIFAGRAEESFAALERALAKATTNAERASVLGWWGYALHGLSRYNEAIQKFEESNALASDKFFMSRWADSLESLGRKEEADAKRLLAAAIPS